jgi:heme-degrading monooxygenase HmoA
MQRSAGMLGGAFSVAADDADDARRFLVTTLWASEAAHAAYARDALPALREQANVADDLESITGRLIRVEPTWAVVGTAIA